jgi:urease accessory protein
MIKGMHIRTRTPNERQMSELQLPLAIWFSPMFPVGAFAYSHGLEWAQEAGDITDVDGLRDWLSTLIQRGALHNDAILLADAYRAALSCDASRVCEMNELALAMATSRERRLETATQGNAFLLAIKKSWPCASIDLLDASEDVAYPIAVALATAGHHLPLDATLKMFSLGFVVNLVSAAIRLGMIGQSDGQSVIAALIPMIGETAQSCAPKTLDDLGGSAFRSDLASMKHETQYTRLFRS